MKYFTKHPLSEVKDRHIIIGNEIINRLTDKSFKKHLRRTNKDNCSKTLYEIVDQIAVWIDQKIDEIDTADLDGETEVSFSTSTTDSLMTDSDALISDAFLQYKKPKRPKRKPEEIKIREPEPKEEFEEEAEVEEEFYESYEELVFEDEGGIKSPNNH